MFQMIDDEVVCMVPLLWIALPPFPPKALSLSFFFRFFDFFSFLAWTIASSGICLVIEPSLVDRLSPYCTYVSK